MTVRSWAWRYAWAILGTAIAILCRVLMAPVLGNTLFYGTLFVAVAVSAVFGGLGPAILATLLGAFAADYFLIPPRFSIGLKNAEDHVGLALYMVISAVLIGLAEKQRRDRQREAQAHQRRQADAIRASEERFRRLVEVSAQTVWVMHSQDAERADSPTWSPIAGRSAEQSLGVPNWLEAVHPDDRERVVDAWLDAVRTTKPFEVELRLRNAAGEYRHTISHAAPVFHPDGAVREWIGMSTDITEQKRTEQALAEAIQRLDAHMDNSPLAVVEFDPEFRVKRWSKEAERLFGWSASEILGRAMFEMHWVYPDDAAAVREIFRDMLQGKRPRNVSVNRNYRRDGAVLECEWYNSAIYHANGKLASVLSQVLDVTDKKRAEERLRQAQRMESIGLLAGGLAHDFNNILASIIGNASLAADMLPEGSQEEDLLERIMKSGEQAAHLTKQMLAYSGKGRFVLEFLNLSEAVREIADLMRASVPKKVDFQDDLEPDLPAIYADRSQIHQILLNLVTNAAEAIGDDVGVITVRTRAQEVDENFLREMEAQDVSPGRYVLLEVQDTGAGMDEATKRRIFDPFFTTKFTGRGLGLSAVLGIVRGHKGAVGVSTAPGKGACFSVFLPAAPAVNTATEKPEHAGKDELRGAGTVLFVDDEEALRQMAKRSLEHYGFQVLLAADGREAVETLKAAADRVGVVVLDLSMPGMSGQETFPELQKIKPGVQVLVSSGYSNEVALGQFAGFEIAGFIHKPYTIQQLVRKVNAAAKAEDRVRSATPGQAAET